MIKAILFDLGGVVFRDGTKEMVKEMQKYGLSKEEGYKILHGKKAMDFRNDLMTPVDFWKAIEKDLPSNLSSSELRKRWYDKYTPLEGIFELIRQLKNKYKLGIISGNIRERIEYLNKKYKFRKFFDVEVYSFDMNVNKPNKVLWKKALDLLKLKPEECVYIDDYPKFIDIANSMGFKAILFKNTSKLKQVLSNLGIKVEGKK